MIEITTSTTTQATHPHYHSSSDKEPSILSSSAALHQRYTIRIVGEIVIDQIWSAAYADFCLLTHHKTNSQYVAYYNSHRQIVIGMRQINNNNNSSSNVNFFDRYILPAPNTTTNNNQEPPFKGNSTTSPYTSTIQGWDSHNYLTLAVDSEGYLHFAGNMHATPLLYYRITELNNISSMQHIPIMINERTEMKSTYPNFILTKQQGELLFHYRFGGIGNGKEFYNIYNTQTKTWSRLIETPLFGSSNNNQISTKTKVKNKAPYDGTTTSSSTTNNNVNHANITQSSSKNSAYQAGPHIGPDGWYHLLWMWRSSPDAETCHDISYAKSQNLKHWVTASGKSLKLPITFENSQESVIDPVPKHGGLLNTVHHIGFDSQHRPIVSYHKHDQNGNTQACVARYDHYHLSSNNSSSIIPPNSNGGRSSSSWNVSIISDWKYHHAFDGTGTLGRSSGSSKSNNISSWINLGIVQPHSNHDLVGTAKELALPFQHWMHGDGLLIFNEETLEPIRVVPEIPSRYPNKLSHVESTFRGISVRWLDDNPFRQHHQEIDPPPPLIPKTTHPTYHHALRWESLGQNRDKPQAKPWPPNSSLTLYTFEQLQL